MSETTKKSKVFFPKIAREECKGCERCVTACPKSVLRMENDLNAMGHPHAVYTGSGCTGCGACFYNCPEPGAITIIEETDDDEKKERK